MEKNLSRAGVPAAPKREARSTLMRWALALLGSVMMIAATAKADPGALSVSDLDRGVNVMPYVVYARDEARAYTMADVLAGRSAPPFTPAGNSLALGFDNAALWLRFSVKNPAATQQPLLLELAYPHLDEIELVVMRQDGRHDRVVTGDIFAFSERPIAHPFFLFPVDLAAHEQATIVVRIVTTGTLTIPLTAWSPAGYLAHERTESLATWLFCGALLMMALFNLAVYALIRQGEYLMLAFQLVFICCATLAFRGDMFALFLANTPGLANKSIAISLTLALAASALTSARVSAADPAYARMARSLDGFALVAGVCCVVAVIVPKEVGARLGTGLALVYMAAGLVTLLALSVRPPKHVRLYLLSWYFPAVGASLTVMANLGYVPAHPLLQHAAYIGCACQALLTSLGLAARVKVMGDNLAGLNHELSRNVLRLEGALGDAREANAAAKRATLAKDEFLATMSHELRTPLNAIINVPQGLLEDFEMQATATCSHCDSVFVLERGDELSPDTMCLECACTRTMRPGERVAFVGDAAFTARFLQKIERAGHHLLELVDGVLDFSKMEAGRFEIVRSQCDLAALIRDSADAMEAPATQRGITIDVCVPDAPLLRYVDRVRLRQVFMNLLSNAIKFTDDGGRVAIDIVPDDAREADLIRVTDSGIGIAPEHHERIFAGFEQVHRKMNQRYGGTGLGLPISRRLMRMHGGDLWVESALGRGSSFVLRLPRDAAASLEGAVPAPLDGPTSSPPSPSANAAE